MRLPHGSALLSRFRRRDSLCAERQGFMQPTSSLIRTIALSVVACFAIACGRTALKNEYPGVPWPTESVDAPSVDGFESGDVGAGDVEVGEDVPDLLDATINDVPSVTDAVFCRSTETIAGETECGALMERAGIYRSFEKFVCCQGQCYSAGSCTPNGPAPARCDLYPEPCSPSQTCCVSFEHRLFCANRITRAGCRN